jgi:CBS domain-containing protein
MSRSGNPGKSAARKGGTMPLIATDIMTSKVITARPDDTLAKIAGLLFDHGISAVPICDKDGGLLGMLSEGDLMRPLGKEKASKRAWWLNLLAEGADLAPTFLESVKVENHPARELMVTPVITAPADATVPELADLLARHRIKRLPILRDGKLIGIVSRADVVRAIARKADEIAEAI